MTTTAVAAPPEAPTWSELQAKLKTIKKRLDLSDAEAIAHYRDLYVAFAAGTISETEATEALQQLGRTPEEFSAAVTRYIERENWAEQLATKPAIVKALQQYHIDFSARDREEAARRQRFEEETALLVNRHTELSAQLDAAERARDHLNTTCKDPATLAEAKRIVARSEAIGDESKQIRATIDVKTNAWRDWHSDPKRNSEGIARIEGEIETLKATLARLDREQNELNAAYQTLERDKFCDPATF